MQRPRRSPALRQAIYLAAAAVSVVLLVLNLSERRWVAAALLPGAIAFFLAASAKEPWSPYDFTWRSILEACGPPLFLLPLCVWLSSLPAGTALAPFQPLLTTPLALTVLGLCVLNARAKRRRTRVNRDRCIRRWLSITQAHVVYGHAHPAPGQPDIAEQWLAVRLPTRRIVDLLRAGVPLHRVYDPDVVALSGEELLAMHRLREMAALDPRWDD